MRIQLSLGALILGLQACGSTSANLSDEFVSTEHSGSKQPLALGNGAAIGNGANLPNSVTLPNGVNLVNGASLSNGALFPNGALLPNGVTLPNSVTLPNGATLGNGVTFANGVTLGNGTILGNSAVLPNGVTLGNGAVFPNSVSLPNGATFPNGAILGNGTILNNGSTLPNGSLLPNGSILGNGTILNNGATFPNGAILPNGTTLGNGAPLPNGTILGNGALFPNGVTFPNGVSLANGAILPPGTTLNQAVTFANGVVFAAGATLTNGATLPAGALLPTGGTGMAAGTVKANNSTFAANTVLNAGAMLGKGAVIGANAVFPNGVTLPNGITFPNSITLPNGTILPNGTVLPNGTIIPGGSVLPNGSSAPASACANSVCNNGVNVAQGTIAPPAGSAFDLYLQDPAKFKVVQYILQCAMKTDQTVAVTRGGVTTQVAGAVGLAPNYRLTGFLDKADQEWVSACLLARVNQTGTTVMIDMVSANHPALNGMTPGYLNVEATVWGNIFANPPQIYARAVPWMRTPARFCNSVSDCAPFNTSGECSTSANLSYSYKQINATTCTGQTPPRQIVTFLSSATCVPHTCSTALQACGSRPNGCGGMLDCGASCGCGTTYTCNSNIPVSFAMGANTIVRIINNATGATVANLVNGFEFSRKTTSLSQGTTYQLQVRQNLTGSPLSTAFSWGGMCAGNTTSTCTLTLSPLINTPEIEVSDLSSGGGTTY